MTSWLSSSLLRSPVRCQERIESSSSPVERGESFEVIILCHTELDITDIFALRLGRGDLICIERERVRGEATPLRMGEAALLPAVSGVGLEASMVSVHLLASVEKMRWGEDESARREKNKKILDMSCRQDHGRTRLWTGMIH